MKKSWNKYDAMLFILILSTIFGSFGAPITIIRVLTILFAPFTFGKITHEINRVIKPIIEFFIFWFFFMVLSLLWTSDMYEGITQLGYYLLNFTLFLEIIILGNVSGKPLATISTAWISAFLLTSMVGIWEITTDHHLYLSKSAGERIRNNGLDVINFRFASVSFYNSNNYGLFICFCLPFIYYSFTYYKRFIYRIISLLALILSIFILFTNSSRGSILSLALMTIIYFRYLFLMGNKKQRRTTLAVAVAIASLFFYYGKFILYQFNFRMTNTELFEDATRTSIFIDAWHLFLDSCGIGTGVGSLVASLTMLRGENAEILIPHNIFIEMLMQYGVILTIIPIIFFLKLIYNSRHLQIGQRMVVLCALLSLPFYGLSCSGYLLTSSLWCFFSSILVFSKRYYAN